MGLRHAVFIGFDDETPPSKVQALIEGLRKLPTLIDGIESYEVGEDLGITLGSPDVTVVAGFADIEAFDRYRAHPEHLRLVEELLEPIASRVSSQFHSDAI